MADLSALGGQGLTQSGEGLFGRLARAQYSALGAMRWQMLKNSLRSNTGIFELGARTITFLVYGSMGVGLGVAAGVVAHMLAARNMWLLLPIEFWVVCLIWQTIPVALASFQEQFDMSGLLRYPVNFGSFYLLYLVFGIPDISTLLGGLCCVGMFCGIVVARPGMAGWAAVGLAGFAVFNILLARAVLAWIDRWLAKRRTREIVSAIFLLLIISMQLLNPAVNLVRYQSPNSPAARSLANRRKTALGPWIKRADNVQIWLPPGLAASAVLQAAQGEPLPAGESLGLLGLWVIGVGGVLAARLRAEYRGENLGEAPSSKKSAKREAAWLLEGSGPISAVMEKELHTMLRSTTQLYAVGVPMLMVFIIASLFRNGSTVTRHTFQLALPLCVAYGLLGFTHLIYNNLGGEGKGIQLLFLSPTPIRTYLLAKNLFHGFLYAVVACVSGALAGMRVGTPNAAVLAATLAWIIFALPANLAAGNVLSLTMAYRVNLGRIGRQQGSQANALLSMLIQGSILGVGAGVIGLCTFADRVWLAAPVLLALAGVSIFAWMRVLGNADSIANQRRDVLIERLAKAE